MLADVWSGLRRNVTMTVAMILTTAISLCLLGAGLLVAKVADRTQDFFGDKVEVTIYLTKTQSQQDPNCHDAVCQGLGDALRDDDDVYSVSYRNQEAAWQRYQKMFAGEPAMLEIGKKTDLNTSWHVKMKNPENYRVIKERYSNYPGVKSVQDRSQVVDELLNLFSSIRKATLIVALIQAIAAFLLISNTVQMAAYTRRTETTIMRLVGASRWRTQLPFALEAIVSSVIGAVIALGGLAALALFVSGDALGNTIALVVSLLTGQDFLTVALEVGGAAIVLGAVSSYATLRLYVRL